MNSFIATFKIIEDKNCPLYELSDVLQLSDKALVPPPGKPVCLILAREMTELLFSLIAQKGDEPDLDKLYSCSGCSGLIKFKRQSGEAKKQGEATSPMSLIIGTTPDLPSGLMDGLEEMAIFQGVGEENFSSTLSYFSYNKFAAGEELYRKGEEGRNVNIILSGKVAVIDGSLTLAMLGRGEVLGEMSQLASQAVCATVKALEETEVLSISGDDLKTVMNDNPSLSLYLLRLLTGRLTRTNVARLQEIASAMSGSLSEMPQVEIFQALNMNAKTGVLTLEFPEEKASISFREGELVYVRYAGKENQEAFNNIVAKKNIGRFSFNSRLPDQDMEAEELGDFMKLLMDALRKVDEDANEE
jgi:CRP/FNR family transcriptional regulator, cyclic AMP receptor protein